MHNGAQHKWQVVTEWGAGGAFACDLGTNKIGVVVVATPLLPC